jgi:hypothetical protein
VFANFSGQESAHQERHVEGLPATSFMSLKNEPEGWAWLQRFLEAILLEALRWPTLGHESLPPGLIAGLHDAHISGSLRAMHPMCGTDGRWPN